MSSNPSSSPYDSSDLQQRIHTQLAGLTELSAYLANRTRSSSGIPSASSTTLSDNYIIEQNTMAADRVREESLGMNRVHLGDEWWADMTEQEMLSFLKRKEIGECAFLEEFIQSASVLNF
jgi:hypothetical protein